MLPLRENKDGKIKSIEVVWLMINKRTTGTPEAKSGCDTLRCLLDLLSLLNLAPLLPVLLASIIDNNYLLLDLLVAFLVFLAVFSSSFLWSLQPILGWSPSQVQREASCIDQSTATRSGPLGCLLH
jgi:hypothetical protein